MCPNVSFIQRLHCKLTAEITDSLSTRDNVPYKEVPVLIRARVSMYVPYSLSDLLEELLVAGESEGGEGSAQQAHETRAEGQQTQDLVAAHMLQLVVLCTWAEQGGGEGQGDHVTDM